MRVERQLALWARRNRPDIRLALFDPRDQCFRSINEVWLDRILIGDQVSIWNTPHPFSSRGRRVLARLLQAFKFRRNFTVALDSLRRDAAGVVSSSAHRLQSRIASPRYRERMLNGKGERRALVSYRSVLAAPLTLDRHDTLVLAGSGWSNVNIGAIKQHKVRQGFRLVVLCHDLIPAMFPHFYRPEDVSRVVTYFEAALPIADTVIFTANKVAADAAAFASQRGITLAEVACLPLGSDFIPPGGRTVPLPQGLAPGKFALFVSTVEPRKGHALLWRIWQRLLDEGVPQRTEFQLVFVGRAGWMLDELFRDLRAATQAANRHFAWLEKADDDLLYALYEKAAFCLYPSVYEGYGLPIVEALAHGRAVLASTGGSIPEVVAGFSPCIDAGDEEAWYQALRRWMLEPGAREPFERLIRTGFRQRSWDEFAEEFFARASATAAE